MFKLSLDGRNADHGAWTGEAQIYAGAEGSQPDWLQVTSPSNGAALLNIGHHYGDAEGSMEAEIHHFHGLLTDGLDQAVKGTGPRVPEPFNILPTRAGRWGHFVRLPQAY
ncbi:hypothetical protein OG239_33105 [Streptomyces sp. NBC_00868]|uniref:hypothetical protein n=1 Tax=unclassified Streptomyces TaxID=2593676 RepID=UPI003246DB1D|nr:hypothetical protein OG239_33105 [Streptomyces sp. NBC_00868]